MRLTFDIASFFVNYIWVYFRYIESSQDCHRLKPSETHKLSYETELQILRDMIQQTVSALLADPENIVKITLAEYGITRLCVFFGKQKGRSSKNDFKLDESL